MKPVNTTDFLIIEDASSNKFVILIF